VIRFNFMCAHAVNRPAPAAAPAGISWLARPLCQFKTTSEALLPGTLTPTGVRTAIGSPWICNRLVEPLENAPRVILGNWLIESVAYDRAISAFGPFYMGFSVSANFFGQFLSREKGVH
jgi:hypothetical protein